MPVDSLTASGAPTTIAPPNQSQTLLSVAPLSGDQINLYLTSISNGGGYLQDAGFTLDGKGEWQSAYPSPVTDYMANSGHGYGMLATAYNFQGVSHLVFFQEGPAPHFTNYSTIRYGWSAQSSDPALVYSKVGVFPSATGFHYEWVTQSTTAGGVVSTLHQEDGDANGPNSSTLTETAGAEIIPYAGAMIGNEAFAIQDGRAQLSGHSAMTFPGVAEAVVKLATLATNTQAAAVWLDGSAAKLSVFDASANAFGPVATLAGTGASDVSVVALPDGSFVASWAQAGAYYGEVFSARGVAGPVVTLAGLATAVDALGELYTTAGIANTDDVKVQRYVVGSEAPGVVHTADASYVAGDSVVDIYLTGSGQTVHGNDGGDTITSNNTLNHITGGAGADTVYIGRGGDVVTGGLGADNFVFKETPWNGGHITDFSGAQGDKIDLTGLLAKSGYSGADPLGDGYLKITDDGASNAQVWADYNQPGNTAWWLVTSLDGVAASTLRVDSGVITGQSNPSGGGSTGQTYTSDNGGDHWTGTAGNDTFNLGRGGDVATGNGGNDTFKFAEVPWAGGHITDFNAGDAIGLTGLLASTG
ncbi:MAG: exsH, partial [Caulobacteraceae bacterium]|nr:exsH [Caulobacteraceae bacterium]